MKRDRLKGYALALVIWTALFTGASQADEIAPNCTVEKAWAAELRSYLPVSKKKSVPATEFFDRQGKVKSISDYRGRSVVLNFWATWCPPCVKEMPALDRMKQALAGQGIDVIAVNEDKKDFAYVAGYYQELGLQHLEIFMDRDSAFMRATKVSSLPTTLLINEQGDEVAAVLNEAQWDSPAIISFVKSCLVSASR